MVSHLTKWIMQRYAKLWSKFKEKPFSYEDIEELLKEDNRLISVFLSELRKAGWLEVELDPEDSRKRVYKLKNPQETILNEIKELAKK